MMGVLCHLPDPFAPPGGDDEFTAILNGGNVIPPTSSNATGQGVFTLTEGNRFQGVVTHNALSVIRGSFRLGATGEEGLEICRDATGPTPVTFDCLLDPDELNELLNGGTYIELNTIPNPNGEIRGHRKWMTEPER